MGQRLKRPCTERSDDSWLNDFDLCPQVIGAISDLLRRWGVVRAIRLSRVAGDRVGHEDFIPRHSAGREEQFKIPSGDVSVKRNTRLVGAEPPRRFTDEHYLCGKWSVCPAQDTRDIIHARAFAARADSFDERFKTDVCSHVISLRRFVFPAQ